MISGSEDRVNPIDKNAAMLAKAMPKAKHEILEGVGHLPEVEAPEKVNALLRRSSRSEAHSAAIRLCCPRTAARPRA